MERRRSPISAVCRSVDPLSVAFAPPRLSDARVELSRRVGRLER